MRDEIDQIGVLGGTFNPVHNGHLALAKCACEQYGLQRVLFLPTGQTYYKEYSGEEMSAHRSQMVTLAIEGDARFQISFAEMESDAVSYTYLTLQKLKQSMPGATLYFLLGADSLRDLPNWRCPDRICEAAVLLVGEREDLQADRLDQTIADLRERLHGDIRRLDQPMPDVSSREIRERVKRGEEISGFVPEAVEQYIRENQLYL